MENIKFEQLVESHSECTHELIKQLNLNEKLNSKLETVKFYAFSLFAEKYLVQTNTSVYTKEKVEEMQSMIVLLDISDMVIYTAKSHSSEYQKYINTKYWKMIAWFVKDKYKKCKRCGNTNRLSVHHKTYKNIGNELNHLDDLECICQSCHAREHKHKIFGK